jgi:hypothetical protein
MFNGGCVLQGTVGLKRRAWPRAICRSKQWTAARCLGKHLTGLVLLFKLRQRFWGKVTRALNEPVF